LFSEPSEVIMLVDGQPTEYYLARDAGGSLWASSLIDEFSTRTVTFTTDDPPSVDAGNDTSTTEGATLSRTLSIDDSDSSEWTVEIDWGDGQNETLTVDRSDPTVNHSYADDGTYPVTVTVTDGHGKASDSFNVSVENMPPTVTIDNATAVVAPSRVEFFIGQAGETQSHAATATDSGADDLTVDWKHGTNETYPNNGTFPFEVRDLDHPWARDIADIFTNLHVVADNGPNQVGGKGEQRRPLAPSVTPE
jgi:hypothetical protein